MGNEINKVGGIIVALIWIIAGIFLLNLTWGWSLIVSEQITDSMYLALYWISYLAMVGLVVFLPPYLIVLNTYKEEDIGE